MRGVIKNITLAGTMLLASFSFCPIQAEAEELTPENQLIALRHVMEQAAPDWNTQNATLYLIGKTGTFQAMMYASRYLNDRLLAKAAAKAVADIALEHPEYNGANTRSLMREVLPLLDKETKSMAKEWLRTAEEEEGYVCIFNGKDLTGWKGLVENPIARSKMTGDQAREAQKKADEQMRKDWIVEDGLLTYVGHGFDNICTVEQYANFEMTVDWRLDPNGEEPDAGVYLRGTPQVQIWDIRRTNVGAQVGSGGLYNNQKNLSTPTSVQDNKLGEWNTFFIRMIGDKVTVKLNGVTVVDDVTMENYWDRSQPIPVREQIEMQAHGSKVQFRDIYVKRIF